MVHPQLAVSSLPREDGGMALVDVRTQLDALQAKISSSSPSMAPAVTAQPAGGVPYAAAPALPTPPLPLTSTP